MEETKKHFFLRLNPPRPTFTQDMSEEERSIMKAHVDYWAPYVQDGTVIVLGPVADPRGGFGMAVVAVDSKEQLDGLLAADPAQAIGAYDVFPMRAVTKQG